MLVHKLVYYQFCLKVHSMTINALHEMVTCLVCSIRVLYIHVCLNLLYKAEKPSVCPSDRHADISAVSASIETGLARNES